MATGKWRRDRTTSAPLRRILLVNIDHVVSTNSLMAALINHVLSKNYQFLSISSIQSCHWMQQRFTMKQAKKKYKPKKEKILGPECRKLQSTQESFGARGFLRCQKEYEPPANIEDELKAVYASIVGQTDEVPDSLKFHLFNQCFDKFKHGVPNSILHTIKTYNDLLEFYMTPVSQTLPLEKMKTMALPPNLHIQYEPLRFHPDEDTMFKGQTAFPKSNTLVTGLRTRKKFKGCKVTDHFPE